MDDEAVGERLAVANEELRVADEELRAQQELIDDLLRSRAADRAAMSQLASALPVPVLDTDAAGVVTGANPAAGELLRLRPALLTGKPIVAFVVAEDRRPVRSALSLALAGRGAQHLNAELRPRKAGTVRVDLAIVPTSQTEAANPAVGRSVAARWVVARQPLAETAASPAPTAQPVVLEALAELASLTVGTTGLRGALERVATLALRGVPGARAASIVVGDPAAPEMLVSTDRAAQAGDGAQHQAEQGPVRDAYATGAAVMTPRLGEDPRWPVLVRSLGRSLGGVLAVPVTGAPEDGSPVGVLTLYGAESLAADDGPAAHAAMFAAAAAAVLREHTVVAGLRALERQLREALESRAVIDQAKGIVMARLGCDPDEAFAALVRQSQDSNTKLRLVAAQLVAGVSAGRPVG